MKQIYLIVILLLSLVIDTEAQNYYILSGKVIDSNNISISGVKVRLKNSEIGTTTDINGHYQLKLEEGPYTLIFSHIAYIDQTGAVGVNRNMTFNIVLLPRSNDLGGVTIRNNRRERGAQIMREVIEHKSRWLNQVKSTSVDIYIKATDETTSKRKKSKPVAPDSLINLLKDTAAAKPEIPDMNVVETKLIRHWQYPSKLKEIKEASKVTGDESGLFYLSSTEGDFNFYFNTLYIKQLSSNTFISPLNSNVFLAYKFELKEQYFDEKDRKVYKIKIIPRKLGNALVSGELHIIDGLWCIKKLIIDLPQDKITEYDGFTIHQEFSEIDTNWVMTRQEFIYKAKAGRSTTDGRTICHYQNYIVNPSFPANFFGDELSVTKDDAYEKKNTYWDSTRLEPLTAKEIMVIRFADSVHEAHNSKHYLDSLDSAYNKVTWLNILWYGQGHINRARQEYWDVSSVGEMVLNGVVSPGGQRINLGGNYYRKFKNRKSYWASLNGSYGLRNGDLKGGGTVGAVYNPIKRAEVEVSIGKQFGLIYPYDAYINLLRRSNFYVMSYFNIDHTIEIRNGLYVSAYADFSHRESVDGLKFGEFSNQFFDNNTPRNFNSYNALTGMVRVKFVPHQLYMREPHEKVILGSRWPTFNVSWRKGIKGVFNSLVDFDYLEASIRQKVNLNIAGISEYSVRTGKFFNTKNVQLIDQRIMRRGDPFIFTHPLNTFQSLDTSFPVYNWFVEGHYIHRFNGFLMQKIPLLRRTHLNEVAGAGFLQTFERNAASPKLNNLFHSEVFFGLERIIKISKYRFRLGGYYVFGYTNNTFTQTAKSPLGTGFKFSIEFYNPRTNQFNF
jgi:hypothetical protein